jgi:hypothetical protein
MKQLIWIHLFKYIFCKDMKNGDNNHLRLMLFSKIESNYTRFIFLIFQDIASHTDYFKFRKRSHFVIVILMSKHVKQLQI